MIAMFDRQASGTIDFIEFTYLFGYIRTMRTSFESYDSARRSFLDINQVNQALSHAKYRFSNTFTLLVACDKFDKRKKGLLSFENFLEMGVFLGSLRTIFQKRGLTAEDPSTGLVSPQFENFIVQELSKLKS